MKISFNWLRELVELKPGVTADSVAQRLTLAGLEVESIERRGRDVRGVLVAEVRGKRPHPTADKLSIVRLVAGGAEEEVVCGAPNVPEAGGKVAWAAPGAVLPGGRTLDRREIRGVMSPGMICSEDELGIGEGHDGIVILPGELTLGAELSAVVGLLDEVLEVNVTPNRPDALSHAGIAREVAGLFGTRWKLPGIDQAAVGPIPPGRGIDVQIREPAACPRYLARLITGVRAQPSPLALRVRLAACGVRAISNIVDATNYVMLELGHPLHAFDLDKLNGGITVRRAGRGERMTTLDGLDRPLQENDIVIADGRGPVALAGVMGGATSEVSASTTHVLLEAATFDPRSVRRTAKRLGLHSEASHRFERGVDANGIPHAGRRAAALIARLGGGILAGDPIDRYPQPPQPRRVTMSMASLDRTAGFQIPIAQAQERLAAIEIPSEAQGRGGDAAVVATVPTFRPDITIGEDLIEEVMRLVGYDRVPARLPVSMHAPAPSPEALPDRARACLAALGLHEVITWAFVPRGWLAPGDGDATLANGVVVKNPISADYELMRTSLLPGLVDAAKRNLARGATDFGLFEVGPVVRRLADAREAPAEPSFAAAIMLGHRPGWLKPGEALDFFDAKQVFGELAAGLSVDNCRFVAGAAGPLFHPGASAEVVAASGGGAGGGSGAGRRLGCVGEIHPALSAALGLEARALYLEIELDAVMGERRAVRSVALPRYPSTTRDISFWIDAEVAADQMREALLSAHEPLLVSTAVLEDFRDPKYTPPGKKGMLWTLTYRADDRTLTDAEVDAAHGRVIVALKAVQAIDVR